MTAWQIASISAKRYAATFDSGAFAFIVTVGERVTAERRVPAIPLCCHDADCSWMVFYQVVHSDRVADMMCTMMSR